MEIPDLINTIYFCMRERSASISKSWQIIGFQIERPITNSFTPKPFWCFSRLKNLASQQANGQLHILKPAVSLSLFPIVIIYHSWMNQIVQFFIKDLCGSKILMNLTWKTSLLAICLIDTLFPTTIWCTWAHLVFVGLLWPMRLEWSQGFVLATRTKGDGAQNRSQPLNAHHPIKTPGLCRLNRRPHWTKARIGKIPIPTIAAFQACCRLWMRIHKPSELRCRRTW